MSELVNMIKHNNFYINKEEIEREIKVQKSLMESLLEGIQKNINNLKALGQGEIVPEIDMTELNDMVVVDIRGVVSVKTCSEYTNYPIYLMQPIGDGQAFRVNIINVAITNCLIGVSISDLKPGDWIRFRKNNICIHPSGFLYSDSAEQKLNFTLQTGQTVHVSRRGNTIECHINGELKSSAPIPNSLSDKPLFPLCWIFGGPDASSISKLRFV